MKQMVAPEAPVRETILFGRLLKGFFRRAVLGKGEIFWGWDRDSAGRCPTYHFPVLEDGSISNHGGRENIYPSETIQTIDPAVLGIAELKFTDERPSA